MTGSLGYRVSVIPNLKLGATSGLAPRSREHNLGTLGHKPGVFQRITIDVFSQVSADSAL